MAKIHIHEDDEGMRNVYPVSDVRKIVDDLAVAQAKSESNLAPDGIGWTDIHVIQGPDTSFRKLEIEWQKISDSVGAILPRIREFEVGFGAGNPFHYRDDDAQCFGFGRRMYIKLETDGKFLNAIWFDATSDDREDLSALRRAFEAIDALHPSMIADTTGLIQVV